MHGQNPLRMMNAFGRSWLVPTLQFTGVTFFFLYMNQPPVVSLTLLNRAGEIPFIFKFYYHFLLLKTGTLKGGI